MTLIALFHVFVALALIVFVLLQDPKGGAAGIFGGGGGGSQSLFGSTGATSFLNKATKWLAIFFAVTSISLVAILNKRSDSVLDTLPLSPPGAGAGSLMEDAPPQGLGFGADEADPDSEGTSDLD